MPTRPRLLGCEQRLKFQAQCRQWQHCESLWSLLTANFAFTEGMFARQLKRHLGSNCRTPRRLAQRIRESTNDPDDLKLASRLTQPTSAETSAATLRPITGPGYWLAARNMKAVTANTPVSDRDEGPVLAGEGW